MYESSVAKWTCLAASFIGMYTLYMRAPLIDTLHSSRQNESDASLNNKLNLNSIARNEKKMRQQETDCLWTIFTMTLLADVMEIYVSF